MDRPDGPVRRETINSVETSDSLPTNQGAGLTPEQYAAAIDVHFQRSKETSLYPGVNYRFLANFLKQSSNDTTSISIDVDSSPSTYDYVVVHRLDTPERRVIRYDALHGHETFVKETQMSRCSSQLVFLRGFSSAQWLNTLGAQYSLDPEFFRRHLDFQHPEDSFDLPPLPSAARNIINLPVLTICHRQTPLEQCRVQQERREAPDEVRKNQRQLIANNRTGDSIVRRFSIHDEATFALEQRISITMIKRRKHGAWISIIWLDTGKDLKFGPLAPWTRDFSASKALCRPVILYEHKAALRGNSLSSTFPASPASPASPSDSFQTASLIPSQYGLLLNRATMNNDPIYALSELFRFSATSESQYLNMIHFQIKKNFLVLESQMSSSLENFRYHKGLLDDQAHSIKGVIRALNKSMNLGGPGDQKGSEAVDTLVEDWAHLLELAQTLAAKCVEGMDIIVSTIQLQESQEAIRQARGLWRLTLLAFFFLPLSITTSFFGMNFREFGTGRLSVWVVFVVLIPVIVVSAALCFWEQCKVYLARLYKV